MSNKRDYYEVLGVKKDATDDELRRAYRKLAMQWHPDRCKDPDAKDKFAEISEAYDVLHDKDKRAQYDQFGFDGLNSSAGFSSEGVDPFEMFKSHFGGMGGFSSMFEDFGFSPFGGNRHHAHKSTEQNFDAPENGDDLQMHMSLTFKEALYGCIKDIDITLDDECPECKGRGIEKGSTPSNCTYCNGTGHIVNVQRNGFVVMQNVSVCPHCHGQGVSAKECPKCHGHKRIPSNKKISIKIPQGISTGQRLRVHGKGECGIKGGKNGDMYVTITVETNKLFSRNDFSLNLTTKVPIDAITATIGGQIDVRTPWETLKVNVPIGTTTGKTVILKGSGIHSRQGNGNLIVEFEIEPFENLDNEQKKLLENFKKILKDNNVYKLNEYKQNAKAF